MSEILPTVTVEGVNGEPLIINQSDYDAAPGDYKLVDAPAPDPVAEKPTGTVLVSKEGTGAKARFYLTDPDGVKVSDVGYESEKGAWDAVLAL